jgi:predicted membrane protein
MQIIDDDNNSLHHRDEFSKDNRSLAVTAALFIFAGIFILAYNLGFVTRPLFRIIISWQMLLIAFGIVFFAKRQVTSGLVLLSLGFFFLIPKITRLGYNWVAMYWPLILVFVGVVLIVKLLSNGRTTHFYYKEGGARSHSYSAKTDNGYLYSVNSFGSVSQVVSDPVFKGGSVKNTFGETILDLRETDIAEGITYLDIESLFGSVEIYVKEQWVVKREINSVFSGTEDKRPRYVGNSASGSVLILRGSATFSGIEIKN